MGTGTFPLLLLLLGGYSPCQASSGSHSLRYFFTGLTDPGPGAPEFYTVGYVDEIPIDWYDSVKQQNEPRAPWMRKVDAEDPQYWEGQTQISRGAQQVFKANVKTLMGRYNQSGGVHTWQTMYSCELGPDGSTRGFSQYGYDGHDFISLDTERLTWVPAMRGAEITERKWNAERSIAERWKVYLEQECIEWVQKYVRYGAQELDRKERPQVSVWDKKSDGGLTNLHCLVTGFYPREIEVKWVKNGQVTMQGMAAKEILPNHDGTYQIRASVDIDPQEEATYACHVDHSSLQESLSVLWEPKSSSSIGIIIGAIVGALLVIALVVGVFVWRKRQQGGKGAGYNVASGKEDGSSTSSGAGPNPAI
ncbi:major histocompatibility complex class I-related gene protein-like [Rhinatrema bivittatum]|uniref:major histocompatibility complex class I-related gene protein-like n=1 Tax=Rhinatrema bivittatum TaxID=194408 RepID=UPI001127EBBD|nr:major histocompatibility complex class I-related gene protein-like [Rhinatrema bivittatum]